MFVLFFYPYRLRVVPTYFWKAGGKLVDFHIFAREFVNGSKGEGPSSFCAVMCSRVLAGDVVLSDMDLQDA